MRGLGPLSFSSLLFVRARAAEPSSDYRRLRDRSNMVVLGTLSVPRDGKPAIVFLLLGTDGSGHPAPYFAQSPNGVQTAEPARIAEVDAEIARQSEAPARWKPDPGVKALIDKTTKKESATQAFKDLEALGRDGVRAIVAEMDDRREPGVQQIELANPRRFWESTRHYGPEKVVDALDAILSQITHEGFGYIYNGGTDAERDHVVAGWRVYDDILRNHPAAPKS